MFALSFVSHLVFFSLILWSMSSPQFHPTEEQVTYVDMVTPPVASPQAGTPAPAKEQTLKPIVTPLSARPPAKLVPIRPQVAAIALPIAKPKSTVKPVEMVKLEKPVPVEDGREFNERLARIQQQSEDKRQAEVLDRLRKGTKKIVGMPSGRGIQVGSDYSSYIQSRLKDAFREMIASQTNAPQVLVRIAIGPDGRITKYHIKDECYRTGRTRCAPWHCI